MEKEVIFIQVGSNEGVMATDPLSSFILRDKWRGVLIEPVPKIFEKLKKNYEGCPNLFFENVAISNERKTCEFFVVDENAEFFKENPNLVNEAGGFFGDLVGSLDREHVLKCKPRITEKELKKIQVTCLTLQDIVDKYKLERIDVLHIDAEGHDDVVLFSLDFARIRPKIVMFEHAHLSMERYFACMELLAVHGYSVLYTNCLDTVISCV
jgi:FkbM family methyltransferase